MVDQAGRLRQPAVDRRAARRDAPRLVAQRRAHRVHPGDGSEVRRGRAARDGPRGTDVKRSVSTRTASANRSGRSTASARLRLGPRMPALGPVRRQLPSGEQPRITNACRFVGTAGRRRAARRSSTTSWASAGTTCYAVAEGATRWSAERDATCSREATEATRSSRETAGGTSSAEETTRTPRESTAGSTSCPAWSGFYPSAAHGEAPRRYERQRSSGRVSFRP